MLSVRAASVWIGVAGGACCAWLAWCYGDEFLVSLRAAAPRQLFVYGVLGVLVRAGYIARWSMISRAMGGTGSVGRLTLARLAADGLGSISPAGTMTGDPLRVVLASRESASREPASRRHAGRVREAAAVALDRIAEAVGNSAAALTYLAVLALSRTGTGEMAVGLATSLGAGLAALVFSLWALHAGYRPFEPFYRGLGAWGSRGARGLAIALRRAERHLRKLLRRQPQVAASAILLSLLVEVAIVWEYQFLFAGFGVDVTVPEVMLSLLAGGVSRAVPTPGGVGAFEAGQVLVFSAAFGRPEVGFALGAVTRLHQLFWLAIGFVGWSVAGAWSARLRATDGVGKAGER